jgi:ALIX V-shaped domain binding to HIV
LEIAKNCDGQIKQQILDCIKSFELLVLSRDSLKNKIPVKCDASELKNSEAAVNLRKDLDELEALKEKIVYIIEEVFNTLNDDNVIPQFLQVLQKKTTEKNVKLFL